MDALLRHLPPAGEIPPPVLEATERAWREEAGVEPEILRPPLIVAVPRRKRWSIWGPALAAAATFLVLLIRPILFVNPLQWQTSVAVASLRGETTGIASMREAMGAWMSRLEQAVRERVGADGETPKAAVTATLNELPDGVLHLRVEFAGDTVAAPLEAWIQPPLDLPAAEAALQRAADDILRALTAKAKPTR
ncbi:MAG: hypothetical protein U1F77_02330 [Kiritimatiellia bacterium]